jgi:purine-binding chemotaxis protein CheW
MNSDGNPLDQWVVLRIQNTEYALPVRSVVEVLRMVALAAMPEAPPWIAGLLNLRGKGILVMNLRQRLGLPALAPDLNTPIVVLEACGEPFGLIADEVVEIVALSRDAFKPVEQLPGSSGLLTAIAHAGERLILILDVDRLGSVAAAPQPPEASYFGA